MTEEEARLEAFFAGAAPWETELRHLRAILRAGPVTETLKWKQPCYTAHGGNVAILWGMKGRFGLSFFKGVLLTDPEGILVAPGENSRSSRMVVLTDLAQVAPLADVLQRYLAEAVALEAEGRRVTFAKDDLDLPEELTEALAQDPALAAAFDALTPGRRRGYILHFGQAKQADTRRARIARWAPRILAGKGMQDR
ncbi:YdeI/OmpD-associated family protein [Salipiger marinus]|uniref:Uncharacterized conserved protein YdeI, YjbR/CyaY-like superfamily, DUF1801 family n=1 Tax=Salipiger marinus TaxID=555512 RepID=A0A1G8HTP9_9RHOB|nr:YdeI/OmpD-associated family protein [Salipiger marinus]SDI10043.1 Uncharacterized conserved protein YdeI, YjbR/CyaY-like superfamily, DUF1801 family [Salipiger marinus]